MSEKELAHRIVRPYNRLDAANLEKTQRSRGLKIVELEMIKFGVAYDSETEDDYGLIDGGVYVFLCEGFAKIGRSSSPKTRLRKVQTTIPFEISLRYIFAPIAPCGVGSLELEFHDLFKDWRVRGEWFESEILKFLP